VKSSLLKFVLTGVPLLFIWGLDACLKNWAFHLRAPLEFGVVRIQLTMNHGMMLGLFKDLSATTKMVILSTIGALLLSSIALVSFFAPIQSKKLRLGLSILAGGILGNITDRYFYGGVVDFLQVLGSPILNPADLFQWAGYGLIFSGLLEDAQTWWPEEDLRSKYVVNLKFQTKVGFLFSLTGSLNALILLSFSFAFFYQNSPPILLKSYLQVASVVLSINALFLFVLGFILSHRVAGPVYAITRYLKETLKGHQRPFKLRSHDEFKEVEAVLTEFNQEVAQKKSA
jgi:signal peptidase II